MPTPLITVVVCLPDGVEYAARSMFGVAPMVGDTLIYGTELELDVWDRRVEAGVSGPVELRTTINATVDDAEELVKDRLERLRFRRVVERMSATRVAVEAYRPEEATLPPAE